MKKHHKHLLRRALALSVALVMCITPVLAATTVEASRTCNQEEHQHTDACYEIVEIKELACTAEGHVHSDACYTTEWQLTCGESETDGSVHTHGSDCYEKKTERACGQSEHTHDSGCYETQVIENQTLTCGEAESAGHTHGGSCYDEEGNLTCGEAESSGHTHGSGCYTTETLTTSVLTCGEAEHTHSSSCDHEVLELVCSNSDIPSHHHDASCYTQVTTLTCGEEETHTHSDACYTVVGTEKKLACSAEAHTHTSDCYENKDQATGKTLQEALSAALKDSENKDVILILNGVTLDYDHTSENGGNAIVVDKGYTLTIEEGAVSGGTIKGNGDTSNNSNSVRIIKVNGGSVTLNGGTLTGGIAVGGGGAVYVGNGGSFTMTGGAIQGNTAQDYTYSGNHYESNGGGVLVEGGSFTMTGGVISGNTSTGGNGGGVAVKDYNDSGNFAGNSSFTMTGGTISGNTAADQTLNNRNEAVGQGGGVYVGQESRFELSGGTISGNTAGEGGGIFVEGSDAIRYYDGTMVKPDYRGDGQFTMTGGTVDGNTATVGEGGGIYLQGHGEISRGQITNNVTYTWKDLGGGGIYIEAGGELKLTNAVITNNTANGLGGGVAACVHGKTIVYAEDGAAIFGNTALGQGHSEGYEKADHTYNGSLIDGYTLWAGNEIFKHYAQDIFTAGDATQTNSQGVAGIVSVGTMLGGGSANWEGYTYCYAIDPETNKLAQDESGKYIMELTKVTQSNNGTVFGNRLVFLTANPDQAAIDTAVAAMEQLENGGVLISGNLSANAHGGGIANNGVLQIGEVGDITGSNSYRPEVNANKTLTDTATGDRKDLTDGQFTFELLDKDMKPIPGAIVTNWADGTTPKFEFPADIFEKADTYTFYVREKKGTDETIGYDGTIYQITIVVTAETETVTVGTKTVTVTTLTVNEPLIRQITDRDGQELESPSTVTGIAFHNTYTKPDEPEDPHEDPEDPEDPDEPEESGESEEPQEEVPDEDVPLANPTEEPQEDLEIPDEDVPLADVPATGDISMLWYAAAALSACGLAALNLKKKENDA